MKKLISCIGFVLLAALTACQPTPQEEFVAKKDIEHMIEQVVSDESGTAITSLNIPGGNYIYEATDTSGKVQITTNAKIVLPETEYMPAVRVSMGEFTQADVQNLYQALLADATPISKDGPFPKGYYRATLDELIRLKRSGKLDKYATMEELDAAIQKVMNEMESAPETAEVVTPDFSFIPFGEGTSIVDIWSIRDNAIFSSLFITNTHDGVGGGYVEYIRDEQQRSEFSKLTAAGLSATIAYTRTLHLNFVPPAINGSKALETAQNVMHQLDLSDFSCTGKRLMPLYNTMADGADAQRKGIYEFMFTRKVNGVAITYTNDDMASDPRSTSSAAKPWKYEKIRVFVDDEGVFALLWNSPYVVGETVTQKATLLPFDEIKTIFERMIVVKNEGLTKWDGTLIEKQIDIQEIRLGLMRVTQKNNIENAILVPVWDFFGTETREGITIGLDGYQSLLTINAIDGSVVDRELGY